MPIMFLPRAKQHILGFVRHELFVITSVLRKVVIALKGGVSFEVPVEGTGLRNLYQVSNQTRVAFYVW